MADVEITLKADSETPETIDTADDGSISGYRCYRARTDDAAKAGIAAAAALPLGMPWSEDYPTLTLRGRRVRYVDGFDDPLSARRGMCLVECTFRTPRFGRLPVPAAPNVAYTEWRKETTQTTIFYSPQDPEATSLPATYGLKINNGDGATRNVTQRVAVVTVYKTALTINLIRTEGSIADYVNKNTVTLPPMLGVGPSLQFAPGELLCMASTYEREGELWKITTELATSPNGFDFLWQAVDDEGKTTGPVIHSPLYLKKDFPAELFS